MREDYMREDELSVGELKLSALEHDARILTKSLWQL
jgi:hypothetical protein